MPLNMAAAPATRSLACEQTIALAMARHARLGAASSAALLEADTVALIFSFVQEAHEELVATKRIASIHVRAGDVIDGIEIRYSDGTHVASGGNGGRWLRPLRLQPGEFITRVGGNKGLYLDSIEFRTSHGAVIRFPGRLSGGVPFVHDIATGHELEHLECLRAPGGWLRSIEGLATQETPWTSRMARLLLGHPSASFLPCPNGPFIQRVGALSAFHDIEVRVCTLAEARARALEMPGCAGFTVKSDTPAFDGQKQVFFKKRRHGNTDIEWQTYLLADWTGADPAPTPWPWPIQ